jgi:hypothetical protein
VYFGRRVGHEVQDELGEEGVERAVVEGQRLGRGKTDVGPGDALGARGDERRRRGDGGDRVGAERRGPGGRQRPRAASDVQRAAARRTPAAPISAPARSAS